VEGTLPAARAVPLAELVGSLDEFDPETPTVVYCAGGYRSLVASSVAPPTPASPTSRTFWVVTVPGPRRAPGRHGHKAARRHHLKKRRRQRRRAIALSGYTNWGATSVRWRRTLSSVNCHILIERTHGGGEGVQGQGLADHLAVPLHVRP